jgi:L-fucose isomerase-like protein
VDAIAAGNTAIVKPSAYSPATTAVIAEMIADFVPIARAVIGVKNLKIITFGPRPQDFFACNAPIKGL